MAGDLTPTDYAFLIILRAEGREISNTEMDARHKVRLTGPGFLKLNAAGYVDSDTKHRPYRHVITAQGRKVLEEPMTVEEDGERLSYREKVLWAALVARPHTDPGPVGIEERIRAAYDRLAGAPGAWVNLAELRPLLAGAPKAEVDAALVALLDDPEVRLEPETHGRRVVRDAAVDVGGEARHKLAIGLR